MEQSTVQYQPLIETTDVERASFYRKTYAHVALATLVFLVSITAFLQLDFVVEFMLSLITGWKWMLVLGAFMLATSYAERQAHTSHSKSTQYGALVLFAVAEAIIFIPLVYIAMVMGELQSTNFLGQAAVITLGLFAALSAVVLVTKKDFSFLRTALTIGFFIALGIIVAGLIFGFDLGLWFVGGMIVLAAGTILYQTSQLVHTYHTDQYVGAALGLFASLMLLFWYVLSFVMSRE